MKVLAQFVEVWLTQCSRLTNIDANVFFYRNTMHYDCPLKHEYVQFCEDTILIKCVCALTV